MDDGASATPHVLAATLKGLAEVLDITSDYLLDGAKVGAIHETVARAKRVTITIPAPVRAVGMVIG